ncbi:hypothetical protein B296_00042219 [Ensete ventricosum]|uniref:Uncharacterized protein n=1 Tax=Ensete ventricosum TaxID=4639 RepID=A0A426XTK2_ENSVE|nr:hypothetical protein B296_00042219 [Ensete ventricosum]
MAVELQICVAVQIGEAANITKQFREHLVDSGEGVSGQMWREPTEEAAALFVVSTIEEIKHWLLYFDGCETVIEETTVAATLVEKSTTRSPGGSMERKRAGWRMVSAARHDGAGVGVLPFVRRHQHDGIV